MRTRAYGVCTALVAAGLCWPGPAIDPEIKAGGVVLTLPGPTPEYSEVGDKLRTTFFELLVPSSNRLLSAYLPGPALAEMNKGNARGQMEAYAMLEVPRRAEYADCTPEAFAQILKGMAPALGNAAADGVSDFQQELNLRLKSLGTKPIEIGRPEMLGTLFQKTDAAGFAMLVALKQDNGNVTMAGGLAALRVKQRLLFAYVYRPYQNQETVTSLGKSLGTWCDAILARNRG